MSLKIKYLLLPLLIVFTQTVSMAQQNKNQFYCFDGKVLATNKADLASKNIENIAAYKQLIKDADKALAYMPVSVMEKTNKPPSGDKHDYMSLAPYFWPDSSKPDGLPYIRRDGVTNPEVKEYKDKEYMPKVCTNAETLALAYYFSDDERYASHAAELIRVWFLNSETKMNPNLNYGQAIKGRNDGRGAGLIDTRHFIKVINAVGLINTSSSWKKNDDLQLKQWFADFLNWMETSPVGKDEMNAENNHGVWYVAQRLAFASYSNNDSKVKEILTGASARLDVQLSEDGFFPKELERTISLHYSAFILDAFFIIAQIAKNEGIDFYTEQTASGKSLKKAFNAHEPFLKLEKEWAGEQIKNWEPQEAYMILMEAHKMYKCKDCVFKVMEFEADKASKLRLKLLY